VNEIKDGLLCEDLVQEVQEDDYKPCNIIDGYNIVCETFSCCAHLEMTLRELKPSVIVLYEPVLEFLRVIEVYNAEREDRLDRLDFYLLSFKHSSEAQDVEGAIV